MKHLLLRAAPVVVTAAMALACSTANTAQPSRYDIAIARITWENAQADAALERLARRALEEAGDEAAVALKVRLAQAKALCQGMDESLQARHSQSSKKTAPTVRTAELQVMKVQHPLCRRLTARYT